MTESRILSEIRLAAARLKWKLWRNNRGAAKTETGSYVRFGLANDSAALGRELQSADLVGWRVVTITPDMVGQRIAQFVSVEVKTPTGHIEPGQYRWADLVNREGGHAIFATSPDHLI